MCVPCSTSRKNPQSGRHTGVGGEVRDPLWKPVHSKDKQNQIKGKQPKSVNLPGTSQNKNRHLEKKHLLRQREQALRGGAGVANRNECSPGGAPKGPYHLQECPSQERNCPPPLISFAVCKSISTFLVSAFICPFIQLLGECLPQTSDCPVPGTKSQASVPLILHSTLATGSTHMSAHYFPLELMQGKRAHAPS